MSVVGGWLWAPLLLTGVVLGHGLLVERMSGMRLDPLVVPSVGLSSLIASSGVLASFAATARLTVPVCAVLGIAGLALGWSRVRATRAGVVAVLLGVAAYAAFALPSLLTGQASIAGYVKLDDSVNWIAIADRVLDHGRDLGDLPVSSYRRALEAWLGGDYPIGAFLPLGVAARMAGQDVAAAFQAVIALYAAVLALGLAACARALVGGPGRAALTALVAVQASLFFGYAQWGGIKEVAAAALLPPLTLLALAAWGAGGVRALPPLSLVAGALVGVLGVNGAVWAVPALAVGYAGAVATRLRSHDAPSRAQAGVRVVAAFVVLVTSCLPALVAWGFVRHTTEGAIASQDEFGNLARPVALLQGAGLWPAGDFRVEPHPRALAVWLALTCLFCAAISVVVAARRRALAIPALVGLTAAGLVPALAVGSPWIDAKALAISSPSLLLAAGALAAAQLGHHDRFTRLIGVLLLVVLAAGSTWSTVAVAQDVYVAPRGRLDELRRLGAHLTGQPLLVLDFEVYAHRYFLRRSAPEGATDLRFRPVYRRDGRLFPEGSTAEVDEVRTRDLWIYRTIARRRSPVASRPPSAYRRIAAGRFWEAWQRAPTALTPVARLPLGNPEDPTGVPRCADVRRLAGTPGVRVLTAVRRRRPIVAKLDPRTVPPSWRKTYGIAADGSGRASVEVTVPRAGRYRIWVGGVVLGRLRVAVDGRSVGELRHELAHVGQWLRFSTAVLTAGKHNVRLEYSEGFRAGSDLIALPIGPVAVSPLAADGALEPVRLPPSRFRSLCRGQRYDWIDGER